MSKAYQVTDEHAGYAVVVFAETPGKAKVLGCQTLESEWTDTRVKRAYSFDGLTPAELTPRAYIERGWWQHCSGPSCSVERLCEDFEGEGPLFDEYGEAYCSEKCRVAGIAR